MQVICRRCICPLFLFLLFPTPSAHLGTGSWEQHVLFSFCHIIYHNGVDGNDRDEDSRGQAWDSHRFPIFVGASHRSRFSTWESAWLGVIVISERGFSGGYSHTFWACVVAFAASGRGVASLGLSGHVRQALIVLHKALLPLCTLTWAPGLCTIGAEAALVVQKYIILTPPLL